jgi:Na+-transporting NADH:ubiquinone oxidoreductase subunit NqrB
MEANSIPQQRPVISLSAIAGKIRQFFISDPRHYQITFLSAFLLYGIFLLDWELNLMKILLVFLVCVLSQLAFTRLANRDYTSVKSALISALSLCLMLRTNLMVTAALAAFLSIAGKFIIRSAGKHIFNPTNFGIIVAILISSDAWISPGQWGNSALLVFMLGALGLLVLLRVKRFDTAIAFLSAFGLYHFLRSVVYLGWTPDVFLQQMTSGTLLIFTFFMITDPKTTPSSMKARIIWASLIGVLAAYLQIHHWVNGSALWALFIMSPFTPVFDRIFGGELFQWTRKEKRDVHSSVFLGEQRKSRTGIIVLAFIGLIFVPFGASSFCGFYVAKADVSLFNKSSQVIIVRDDDHTVVTMSSDYTGELQDFAMVVPVPVVLKKSDIRTVERVLFDSFDAYSGPRLVEYWDQNPCWDNMQYKRRTMNVPAAAEMSVTMDDEAKDLSSVKIEARYVVGEYDILILSAEESTGLEKWLITNGYRIPSGAKDVLEPYIRSGMKFFVVKVNLEGFRKEGNDLLRPLQIAFHSPKFMLPIRLGMANSMDSQDMIVYALSRKGRVETSNYRTVSMPTDKKVPLFVKDDFGAFYRDTYKKQVEREGKRNVFLEYAWDLSGSNFMKCDPCASNPPVYEDLVNAGATWLRSNRNGTYDGTVYFTRLHVTYDRANFAQDLVFQETPNKQNFQSRFVLTHMAPGPFDCSEGKAYLREVQKRRYRELQELHSLTGWDIKQYDRYLQESMGYSLPDEPVIRKLLKRVHKINGSKAGTANVTDTNGTVQHQKQLSKNNILSDTNIVPGDIHNWHHKHHEQEAGSNSDSTDYKIILAMMAIAVLFLIERRRR